MKTSAWVIQSLHAPSSPAHERPFAGACSIFCPLRGNLPSFQMYSRNGNDLSAEPRRSLHHLVHALNQGSPPQECRLWLCLGESHTLPKPEFCKKPVILSSHLPSLWSELSSCVNPKPHTLKTSSFFSLEEKFPSLHISEVFVSPNSLPCTLHLPHCLPPTTEILFSILRWISWMFQVI